jgi:hypothetical protein
MEMFVMAYPSVTLYKNKLPTGTAGIDFYDAIYPNGDRPVDEYDAGSGFKLIVEAESANGSFMSIELAKTVPWRFGSSPAAQVLFGFGQGPLYTQEVDSSINNPVDPVTGNQWSYKNPYTIKESSGWR